MSSQLLSSLGEPAMLTVNFTFRVLPDLGSLFFFFSPEMVRESKRPAAAGLALGTAAVAVEPSAAAGPAATRPAPATRAAAANEAVSRVGRRSGGRRRDRRNEVGIGPGAG